MVPFQHVSETTASPFVQFPKGRVGWGASSCTVANWQPSTDSSPFPLDLELLSDALPLPPPFSFSPSPFLLPLFDRLLHGGNRPETTGPRYYCPDLKDDVVGELIHRCDVITSASMAGLFKPILDSTNNIITRNPRVKERFDLPYLLRRDPDDWRWHDGGLAVC